MFGRRRATQDDPGIRAMYPVVVAVAPIRTAPPATPHPGGGVGHANAGAAAGVMTPHQYNSGYAGSPLLTQRPGRVDEIQLWQGVEGMSSFLYTPPRMLDPVGYSISQQSAYLPDVQRTQGGNRGGLGPITARKMRQNVTAQQMRQSGLSALQWAAGLSST